MSTFARYRPGPLPGEPGPEWWGLTWRLSCPECGHEGIDRDTSGAPNDHEAVTIQPDRDGYYSPIGTKGGYVQIDLMCEGGAHRCSLIVANHKGEEVIGLVRRGADQ